MVERRHQLDVRRQQHAVAEHVAGHVADACDGERRLLDVLAKLAEVALHRFPRAARGDAHLLVVVAGRATRGEGIVEPEAVVAGQRIGDVGEGGRALVGGDHEIGVVGVVAHHVGRRHHAATRIIVGDVEQAADQGLVAGDAFGLDLLARAACGGLLHVEAALRSHRHDDGVLHHLRLHQAEDLGAEILAPVGPADSTARDASAAQVDALHARAVHEDLDQWPRRRQFVDRTAVDLEGDPVLGAARLPVVGAQRAEHGIVEAPQDAVLVERADRFERGRELRLDRGDPVAAVIGSGIAQRRIETRPEEVDHQARHLRVGGERTLHVFLAERDAGLSQILRIGAHDGDLAPGQSGAEHEPVQPVVFERARAQLLDRLDEARPRGVEIDGRLVRGFHAQHLHGHAMALIVAALLAQQERRLADDTQAEVFGERQNVGQRDRLARMEQAEREAMCRHAAPSPDLHAEPGAVHDRLQQLDVDESLCRVEGLPIDGGKPVAPATGGGTALGFAEFCLKGGAQPVVPRGRRVHQRAFELGEIGARLLRRVELQRVERLDQRGIAADRGGDRSDVAVPGLLEDGGEAGRERLVEALARHEDQRGGEAADRVQAREQRDAPSFLKLQDAEHMVVQRILVDLEQLVSRIGIEDRQQRLAVMSVAIEARPSQQALDPAAQQRDVVNRRVIGRGGEEADQPVFAGDATVGVAGLHDHAIHRAAAMDQRLPVGLHDQDVVRSAREAGHRLAAADAGLEQAHLVAAQDAQRRSRHNLVAQAGGLARILDIAVAAMAEEGEMVGLEPAQEILVLGQVRRVAGREVEDGVEAGAAHRTPVVDRDAHLGQHAGQRRGDLVQQHRIGLAIDLDVHHRFGARAFAGFERDAHQIAVEIASRRHHRMSEQVDGNLPAIEFVGDRIDQKRHVVVHDLHDRVTALEAVVVECRIEDPYLGDAGQAAARERQERDRRRGPLLYRRGRQILVGYAAEQAACELCGFLAAGLKGGGADGVQPIDTRRRRIGHILCIPRESGTDVTPDHDILTTESW